jgi:hypothetical protein
MSESSGDFSAFTQEPDNLVQGVLFGTAAALVGAALWAVITVLTGYQIGFMAIGVGVLVGLAVRRFGRGSTPVFGIAGAVLSLAGCVAGNLLAVVGFIAQGQEMPFFATLGQVDLPLAMNLLIETADPIDFLFYAIAVYEGFKLAIVPAPAAAASSAPGV